LTVEEARNALAAAITNAHAALRWLSADPPNLGQVRNALDRIVEEGSRASDVVGRLRALSKKAPPLKDSVAINEAVLDVVALTRGAVVKNGVLLRTELAENLPCIQADRELRQWHESLTPRERDVMTLVVTGLLNKQIAAETHTSEATVKAHRAEVMRKMRAQSLAQLLRIADRLGLGPFPH
jgi:DNA-binding CsgD family transcriptional regulator